MATAMLAGRLDILGAESIALSFATSSGCNDRILTEMAGAISSARSAFGIWFPHPGQCNAARADSCFLIHTAPRDPSPGGIQHECTMRPSKV